MAFSAEVEMASVKMASALEALGPEAAKETWAKAAWPIWRALPIQPKLEVMPQGEATLAEWAAQAGLVGAKPFTPLTALVESREARHVMA
jgi:hypothetical protein